MATFHRSIWKKYETDGTLQWGWALGGDVDEHGNSPTIAHGVAGSEDHAERLAEQAALNYLVWQADTAVHTDPIEVEANNG